MCRLNEVYISVVTLFTESVKVEYFPLTSRAAVGEPFRRAKVNTEFSLAYLIYHFPGRIAPALCNLG